MSMNPLRIHHQAQLQPPNEQDLGSPGAGELLERGSILLLLSKWGESCLGQASRQQLILSLPQGSGVYL